MDLGSHISSSFFLSHDLFIFFFRKIFWKWACTQHNQYVGFLFLSNQQDHLVFVCVRTHMESAFCFTMSYMTRIVPFNFHNPGRKAFFFLFYRVWEVKQFVPNHIVIRSARTRRTRRLWVQSQGLFHCSFSWPSPTDYITLHPSPHPSHIVCWGKVRFLFFPNRIFIWELLLVGYWSTGYHLKVDLLPFLCNILWQHWEII